MSGRDIHLYHFKRMDNDEEKDMVFSTYTSDHHVQTKEKKKAKNVTNASLKSKVRQVRAGLDMKTIG